MGILRFTQTAYRFRWTAISSRYFSSLAGPSSNILVTSRRLGTAATARVSSCYHEAKKQLQQHQIRLLSSNSTTTTASATSASPSSAPKDDKSNMFLDHLGSIFLAGVGLLIASLTRSYMGSTNRNAARDSLQERASLDPLEIDDLRVANSELTLPIYRKITADLLEEFPSKTATYEDVVKTVRATMAGLKGDAFTIELGHLIDRVVLSALKDHGQSTQDPQPLAFWLTVISLALNAPVPDRIMALHEVLRVSCEEENVTLKDARSMVGYLQDTCQLVPDSQVIPTKDKYPIQQHGRGKAGELFEWDGPETETLDIDAFSSILRSRAVCAWGECYVKRKHA